LLAPHPFLYPLLQDNSSFQGRGINFFFQCVWYKKIDREIANRNMTHPSSTCSYGNVPAHTQQPESFITAPLAVLSNIGIDEIEAKPSDVHINLLPHDLTYGDFLETFFHNKTASFQVSPSHANWGLLRFNNQSYKVHRETISFNLYDAHRDAYATKHNVPKSKISIVKNLLLRKELHSVVSLAGHHSHHHTQVAESLHDTLADLVDDGILVRTGDQSKGANMSFTIQFTHHSHVLGTTVTLVFAFRTVVPGYVASRNIAQIDAIEPYSEAEHFFDDDMPEDHDNGSVDSRTIASNNDASLNTKHIVKMMDGEGESAHQHSEGSSGRKW